MEKVDLICEEEQVLKSMPGFRFHPTEEELVGFYLRHKIAKKPFKFNLIQDLDLYDFEPWDLPGLAVNGGERWFFFAKPRGHTDGRPNRITAGGFWKATGKDRSVYSHSTSALIGMRKTLVFYKGRALKAHKTDWIMNEYRLHSDGNENVEAVRLCRIYRKAISMRSLDLRQTALQVEKRDNNEISRSSSSLVAKDLSQGNSAHSFADCRKASMEVKIEDLTHVSSLERWWCWDGGSSSALAFLWD